MSGTKNMGLWSKRVCGKLEGTGLTALVLLKERMQHGDLQGQRGGWSMGHAWNGETEARTVWIETVVVTFLDLAVTRAGNNRLFCSKLKYFVAKTQGKIFQNEEYCVCHCYLLTPFSFSTAVNFVHQ